MHETEATMITSRRANSAAVAAWHLHVLLHELASFDDSEPASTVRDRGTAVGHHYFVMDDISGRPLVV